MKHSHITMTGLDCTVKIDCNCCGGQVVLVLPIEIKELSKWIENFKKAHKDCK